jgi:ubiquitin-activating enzyme E1
MFHIPTEDKHIALCTLKSYPYLIEHCIEYSRDRFFNTFEQDAEDASNFCKNPNSFYNNMKEVNYKALQKTFENIDRLTALKETNTFEACVQMARDMYDDT